MNGEVFVGTVILVGCCWVCAALFLGIGIWAGCRRTPMHFWAGTEVAPGAVSDISAYNRENGRMWIVYSLPYWLAGIFGLFLGNAQWCAIAALILLVLACFPGLPVLIACYRRIERKYIS